MLCLSVLEVLGVEGVLVLGDSEEGVGAVAVDEGASTGGVEVVTVGSVDVGAAGVVDVVVGASDVEGWVDMTGESYE